MRLTKPIADLVFICLESDLTSILFTSILLLHPPQSDINTTGKFVGSRACQLIRNITRN
jgi:hypothetical protein